MSSFKRKARPFRFTCHGVSCYGRGLFEEAEEYLLKGVCFLKRVKEKLWNYSERLILGEIYFEKGNFPRSEEWFGKGCWLIKDARVFPSSERLGTVGLIRAKIRTNPKDTDLESLYTHSTNNKLKMIQG
jgi:hypothetical protein